MRPIDESCDKSLLSNWLYFTVNPKLISAIWLDDYIIKTNYWMSFSIFRNFFLTWSCRIRSLRVLFRIRLKSQNTSKPSFTNNYLISQKVILESRFTRHFETSMSKNWSLLNLRLLKFRPIRCQSDCRSCTDAIVVTCTVHQRAS